MLETRLKVLTMNYLPAIPHTTTLPLFILEKLESDFFRWLTVTHSSRESARSGQGAGGSGWKVSHCSSCLCRVWLMNKRLVFYPDFQLNFGKHRHLPKCLEQFMWLLNEWLHFLEQSQSLKHYSEKISNDQWTAEISVSVSDLCNVSSSDFQC